VVLSEELWRNVRGTRLGGIGRNRQAQGEFKGRSGGKVVELCGFLSIPPVHCSGELQGLSGELQGLFRMRGNCKDSLSCKELQGLHYRGIVVDPGGKQVEHGQVELKCIKSHYPHLHPDEELCKAVGN